MSTLSAKALTLVDIAKRLDPDGKAAMIAEVLSQDNPIVTDIPWIEGNLPTGDQVTIRTGLPAVYFRKLNAGVPNSKSTTAQITETCGIMEAYSAIDLDVLSIQNDAAAFREQEAVAFIEAMNQQMATSLFYGDSTLNPEQFNGMGMRYASLSATNGANIIDAAGNTNLASMWLIGWGQKSAYGIYPKGSVAGLMHKDLGQKTLFDANNNRYQGVEDQFQWKCGSVLKDWRYAVRVANIDTAALTKGAATGADLIDLVTRMAVRLHSANGVMPVVYGNRTIEGALRRQMVNKPLNSTLRIEDAFGKQTLMCGEFPFHRCDALTNSETKVT